MIKKWNGMIKKCLTHHELGALVDKQVLLVGLLLVVEDALLLVVVVHDRLALEIGGHLWLWGTEMDSTSDRLPTELTDSLSE